MLNLKFSEVHAESRLQELASAVTQEVYGEKLWLKEDFATGYIKLLHYSNGLKACVSNFVLNQDLHSDRSEMEKDAYLLQLNQVTAKHEFSVWLNNVESVFDNQVYHSVFLTHLNEKVVLTAGKGACFSQLNIIIPRQWLIHFMQDRLYDGLLEQYFNLKDERLSFDAFDATYRSLADKVMHTADNDSYLMISQEILTVIIERFISRMANRLQRRNSSAA